jgi:hypothetical protein
MVETVNIEIHSNFNIGSSALAGDSAYIQVKVIGAITRFSFM